MSEQAEPYPFVRPFELALLRQLQADPSCLPRLSQYLEADRFPSEDLRLVVASLLAHYKRLGRVPTGTSILQEVRNQVDAGKLTAQQLEQAADCLEQAADCTPTSTEHVLEQVCQQARKRAVWSALDNGLRLYGSGQLDRVVAEMARADLIGRADQDPGLDLFGTAAERSDRRKNARPTPKWGTGIVEMDDVLQGGLAAGELGVAVGGPGSGKSTYLVGVATHTILQGGTAIYYSFEMAEQDLADRIDSNCTQIPINDLRRYADHVGPAMEAFWKRTGGCCIIKKFPARVTSCRDLRAHLQMLRATRSIVPSMLILDYPDKMASSEPARYEKDHQIVGAIYDEVRNLAAEFGCPAWGASQTNAEGDDAKVAGGGHVARAREKWANADVMFSINRTDDERQAEQVRLHMIKIRTQADGMTLGPLRSDYGRGQIVARTRQALED